MEQKEPEDDFDLDDVLQSFREANGPGPTINLKAIGGPIDRATDEFSNQEIELPAISRSPRDPQVDRGVIRVLRRLSDVLCNDAAERPPVTGNGRAVVDYGPNLEPEWPQTAAFENKQISFKDTYVTRMGESAAWASMNRFMQTSSPKTTAGCLNCLGPVIPPHLLASSGLPGRATRRIEPNPLLATASPVARSPAPQFGGCFQPDEVRPLPNSSAEFELDDNAANFDDVSADLLRPMLRQWIAENMHLMVEKALRMEMNGRKGR
jgi:hypothetical protein